MGASIHLLLGKQAAARRAQGHRQGPGAQQALALLPRASIYSELSTPVCGTDNGSFYSLGDRWRAETLKEPCKNHTFPPWQRAVLGSQRIGISGCSVLIQLYVIRPGEHCVFLSCHITFNGASMARGTPGKDIRSLVYTQLCQPSLSQDIGHWDSERLERAHYTLTSLAQAPKSLTFMYLEDWLPFLGLWA